MFRSWHDYILNEAACQGKLALDFSRSREQIKLAMRKTRSPVRGFILDKTFIYLTLSQLNLWIVFVSKFT
jgi:hypothetical protein